MGSRTHVLKIEVVSWHGLHDLGVNLFDLVAKEQVAVQALDRVGVDLPTTRYQQLTAINNSITIYHCMIIKIGSMVRCVSEIKCD